MARFSGFDYEVGEKLTRSRAEWREWIAENRTRRSARVRLADGETRVSVQSMGAARPHLIAEIYATPSQLGIRTD